MDLRQLEYLVAVAEERNFTRAAQRVHISQSGVSAQIRQLERELGADLFDRSTRAVTLTVAGKAALDHARAALAAARAVGQAVDQVTGLVRGQLRIGTVIGCTLTPLFDALAAFHAAHPGVEMSLLEDHSDRLVEGVSAGTLDLALIGAVSAIPEGLEALTLVSERLVIAVPAGHPLATVRRVTPRELSRHPIVCMPVGTGLRAVFDQACAAHGFQPTVALQANAVDAIADLALRGLAVAVLTESMAARHRERLTVRSLEDVEGSAKLALVWRGTHSPAVREALACARESFTKPAPTAPNSGL